MVNCDNLKKWQLQLISHVSEASLASSTASGASNIYQLSVASTLSSLGGDFTAALSSIASGICSSCEGCYSDNATK